MSIVTKLWDGLRASYTKLVVAELNSYGVCGHRVWNRGSSTCATPPPSRGRLIDMLGESSVCQCPQLISLTPRPHDSAGLRYQDLFLEDDTTTKAIHMLSPEEQLARYVRS